MATTGPAIPPNTEITRFSHNVVVSEPDLDVKVAYTPFFDI